ncbi:MAG: S8 family serine peptidase, partial [bacterium]
MAHNSRISSEKLRQKRALSASVEKLEQREVLAPFVSTNNYAATFTAATTPTEANLGTITLTQTAKTESAAGFTSVTQLSSKDEFGKDIVRIQAGPGGDFGKGIYAISRGAGSNTAAVNRPGTIYRVDTATGKASVFFDMASMIQKLQNDPTANASNGVSNSSGLVNWYDITFDPEGYFFGRSAMLVSTVSNNDPTKNAVYAIGSDGSLIGALVQFTAQGSSQNFAVTPSAVLVPPVQFQNRIRGLFTGTGTQDTSTTPATYTALFFDSNTYRPGQNINTSVLPPGVFDSNLNYGPQVGLTASNNLGNYGSQIFSAFTNFGVGSSGGLPGNSGFSGIDGVTSGLFISPNPSALQPAQIFAANASVPSSTNVDQYATAQTAFRRFQDIAFDQFGYFSYGSTVTPATGTTTVPTYVGSMFVTDMGNGLAVSGSVTVNSVATNFYAPVSFNSNSGTAILSWNSNTQQFVNQGSTFTGGRVLRVAPDGTMRTFAENFNVSSAWDSSSFVNSSFSITFAADGTKMWVSDDDGIWQLSSTLSLAGSTTGNQIGLNDLRSLGVPYEGQNTAVAVLDTGVDATNTSFRGRVAKGVDINKRRGAGNIDTASGGHGTQVAGVVAQLVPESTIQPINLFVVGATAGGTTGGTTTATLGVTSNQAIFKALQFLSKNPYVNDPVRPGQKDRIVASTLAWGTQTSFPTEGQAFQAFPQVVASFKQQLARIRKLGITTVAAAGQFGVPQGGTSTTGGTTTVSSGDFNGMAMPAVLNEVVSVGMTSPMPFYLTPNTDPMDPNVGPAPRAFLPIQFRTTGQGGGGTTTGVGYGQVATMTNGQPFLYADDMLYASNTSITTDFVAPGVDVPTFAQTTGTNTNPLRFDIAGTSMSAGITAGSFALVSSAVNYWTRLAKVGATSDAYLTQPVSTNTLNFGKNALKDMSLYANPDGINSILQWTAVPVNYNLFNDISGGTTNNTTSGNVIQPQTNLSYSRIDVGNAIASIEGQVAIQYMIQLQFEQSSPQEEARRRENERIRELLDRACA